MLKLSQNHAFKRLRCVKNKLFAHPVLKYEINTQLTMGALALWHWRGVELGERGSIPGWSTHKSLFVLTVVASIESQLNFSNLSYSHGKMSFCV
jgi:hypothetical protein